ncbi:hypothetical protein [Streptomyces sp. NPDC056387]|uniref:effector-associated constant component EACC1 n=1 Tax=Streptomyces sp. NPDC056387 TaxID=3345803 RepID=UPI0035E10199
MTEFELRVADDREPEAELRSLLAWLSADETVGAGMRGRIGGDGPPEKDHMSGGGFDVLQLAVGSGLSTASLVFAVLQWRLARLRPPGLTVRRGPYEVRIEGPQADDPEVLLRIVAALDGEDDGSS